MNNEIQRNSKGATQLLYNLEQLTDSELMEAAPLLDYKSAAELSRDLKELRGYVRGLELDQFPRELIG